MNTPANTAAERPTPIVHSARQLPSVDVDSYSLELEDEEGFAGDQANKGAFVQILDELRKLLRNAGEDPLGSKPSAQISRKKLADLLVKGDPQEAALVQSAVEGFAQQLHGVIRGFLKHKSWQGTECIVMGGGLSGSRVGQLAIARANIMLKEAKVPTELKVMDGDPDEAALIGTAHLLPSWMLEGHQGMLAVDIGGTHIRAGVVQFNLEKAKDLSKACVLEFRRWCHRDEGGIKREDTIDHLIEMLDDLLSKAEKLDPPLAPIVGVGCPGVISEDGSIARGAHNLPGNWHSSRFNLPRVIHERLPHIGKYESVVVMHNDAVIQGLSQLPYMRDRKHWGILTIGTGLGNARFSRRRNAKDRES